MKVLKIIGVFMFGCIGIGILSGYDGSQHTSSNLVFGIIFVLLGFCFLYSIMRSTKRATTEKQIPDNAVGFSPSANESEIADDSNQDSLILLSEQKKMFLVNYLGDRSITWHIDEPVKERYPDIEQNIEDLQKAGLIKKEKGVYVLTESGQEMRKTFRAQERARREEMHQSAVDFALSGDYLSAYNARAKYEKESVIPHGISVNLGGGSNTPTWEVASEIPYNIKNYIGNSCKLDFSDCENSERFKEALRRFYIGVEATGSNSIDIPDDFEERLGEKLLCPALDAQLAEKCQFPNPPKLKIYFRTKVRVSNYISTKLIKKWDGKFDLGIYDCTSPLHASMAQYDRMTGSGIDGFPKTFKTFEKHKKANSEKYKAWMNEYSRIVEKKGAV